MKKILEIISREKHNEIVCNCNCGMIHFDTVEFINRSQNQIEVIETEMTKKKSVLSIEMISEGKSQVFNKK